MEALLGLISRRLREWVDARHGGNISKAAHVMKVDYHLVYKSYHGTLKSLAFFQAYDILKHIVPDDFKNILGEYFPDNMRSLLEILETDSLDPMESLNQKVSSILESQISYAIFAMAEKGRCKREDLIRIFGSFGLRELDRLLADSVLTINGEGEINTTISGHVNPAGSFLRAAVEYQIASICLRNSGTLIDTQYACVNEKGLKESFAIMAEAAEKLKAVLADVNNRGEILFFGTSFCGPFDVAGVNQ